MPSLPSPEVIILTNRITRQERTLQDSLPLAGELRDFIKTAPKPVNWVACDGDTNNGIARTQWLDWDAVTPLPDPIQEVVRAFTAPTNDQIPECLGNCFVDPNINSAVTDVSIVYPDPYNPGLLKCEYLPQGCGQVVAYRVETFGPNIPPCALVLNPSGMYEFWVKSGEGIWALGDGMLAAAQGVYKGLMSGDSNTANAAVIPDAANTYGFYMIVANMPGFPYRRLFRWTPAAGVELISDLANRNMSHTGDLVGFISPVQPYLVGRYNWIWALPNNPAIPNWGKPEQFRAGYLNSYSNGPNDIGGQGNNDIGIQTGVISDLLYNTIFGFVGNYDSSTEKVRFLGQASLQQRPAAQFFFIKDHPRLTPDASPEDHPTPSNFNGSYALTYLSSGSGPWNRDQPATSLFYVLGSYYNDTLGQNAPALLLKYSPIGNWHAVDLRHRLPANTHLACGVRPPGSVPDGSSSKYIFVYVHTYDGVAANSGYFRIKVDPLKITDYVTPPVIASPYGSSYEVRMCLGTAYPQDGVHPAVHDVGPGD